MTYHRGHPGPSFMCDHHPCSCMCTAYSNDTQSQDFIASIPGPTTYVHAVHAFHAFTHSPRKLAEETIMVIYNPRPRNQAYQRDPYQIIVCFLQRPHHIMVIQNLLDQLMKYEIRNQTNTIDRSRQKAPDVGNEETCTSRLPLWKGSLVSCLIRYITINF